MSLDLAYKIVVGKLSRDVGRTKLCIRQKVGGPTLLRRTAHFLTFPVMSFVVK